MTVGVWSDGQRLVVIEVVVVAVNELFGNALSSKRALPPLSAAFFYLYSFFRGQCVRALNKNICICIAII